jgi:hypothetical protein
LDRGIRSSAEYFLKIFSINIKFSLSEA